MTLLKSSPCSTFNLTFSTSKRLTLTKPAPYQDKRALPGNLRSRKYKFMISPPPPPVKISIASR